MIFNDLDRERFLTINNARITAINTELIIATEIWHELVQKLLDAEFTLLAGPEDGLSVGVTDSTGVTPAAGIDGALFVCTAVESLDLGLSASLAGLEGCFGGAGLADGFCAGGF
jgi:hypothetical protein